MILYNAALTELKILEEIGQGSFGHVYKAIWWGGGSCCQGDTCDWKYEDLALSFFVVILILTLGH